MSSTAREPLPVADGVGGGLADRQRLENRLAPQPILQPRKNGRRFGAAQIGEARAVAAAASVDLVERGDGLDRGHDLRVIGCRLLEPPEYVVGAQVAPGSSRSFLPLGRFI